MKNIFIKCFLAILVTLTISTSLTVYLVDGSSTLSPDPSPLAKILQEVLEALLEKRYNDALNLCREALNISLPPDLSYTHVKLYKKIEELTIILNKTDTIITIGVQDYKDLRNLVYELSLARLEAENLLNEYLNRLSRYFLEPATKYIISRTLASYVQNLDVKLESMSLQLVQIYLKGHSHGLEIIFNHPQQAYGGEVVQLVVSIRSEAVDLNNVNLSIFLIYENLYIKSYNFTIPVNEEISLEIGIPSAENLVKLGINPALVSNMKLFVTAMSKVGETLFYSYKLSNITVIYERPPITVFVTSVVRPHDEYIDINISSNAVQNLSMSIYIDKVANETLIKTFTLEPGHHLLKLPLSNVSIGYHRLIFVVPPSGRYVGYSFSYTFVVLGEEVSVVLNLNPLAVVPISNVFVDLYVDSPTNYSVTLYIDGKLSIEYNNLNVSKIRFELKPPFTIFLNRYSVSIEVKPGNSSYMPTYVNGFIYVLNLPSFLITVFLLTVSLSTPSKAGYIVELLKPMRYLLSRTSSKTMESSISVLNLVKMVFKEARLAKLYRRFLIIISKYVEPPRSSETLREFYSRFDKSFSRSTKVLVKRFLDIYELDLYSNISIDVREAENVVKELEKS